MPVFQIGPHRLMLPDPPPRPARGGKRPPAREPRLSQSPWWGFSGHDIARTEPLPRCPNARCRRAKACLAAIEGLYCLRTHHSRFEQQWLRKNHPLARRIAAVPRVEDRSDSVAIAKRSETVLAVRREFEEKMRARWKAGAFDALYGKWQAKGAVMRPPVREWKG